MEGAIPIGMISTGALLALLIRPATGVAKVSANPYPVGKIDTINRLGAPMADDILSDCMGRLLKAGLAPDVVVKTISAVRRDWGGVATYLPLIDRETRDKAISECLTAGLPIDEVAKKVGCSARTIRRRKSEFLI